MANPYVLSIVLCRNRCYKVYSDKNYNHAIHMHESVFCKAISWSGNIVILLVLPGVIIQLKEKLSAVTGIISTHWHKPNMKLICGLSVMADKSCYWQGLVYYKEEMLLLTWHQIRVCTMVSLFQGLESLWMKRVSYYTINSFPCKTWLWFQMCKF